MTVEVELASLGVEVDATAVDPGIQKLHSLADAGGLAEAATTKLTTATEILAAETRRAAGATSEVVSSHGAATAAIQGEVQAIMSADAQQRRAIASAGGYTSANREMAEAVRLAEQVERAAFQSTRQLEGANISAAKSAMVLGASYKQLDDHVMSFHLNAMRAGAAAQALGAGHLAAAKGAKLQGYEVLNLTRNLADVFVTGAMGMNPFMIAVQQGPQIADIFQTAAQRGVKASAVFSEIGSIVGRVLGVAGPFAIGAAVVGTLGAAFIAGEKDANRFANALAITGNFAGVTAGQLEAMSQRVATSVDAGAGKARDAIGTLTSTGRFAADTIEMLSRSAVLMADYSGETAGKVAADFGKMSTGVADYAVKFNEQHHLMSFAQLEHIRMLEETGRVEEAQYAASVAIYEGLGRIGPANLGLLERAWRSLAGTIGEAWDALKKFGSPEAAAAGQMATLASRISQLQRDAGPNPNALAQGRINALQDEWIAMAKVANQAEVNAKKQSEAARTTDAATAAAAEHRKVYGAMGESLARVNQEIANYRSGQEAIRKANPASVELDSATRQREIEASIRKKLMPSEAAAASKAASAADSAAKSEMRRAKALSEELAAMDAATAGALATARAYGVSDAAALRSIATSAARSKAAGKGLDEETFVQRQLDLNAAKAAENAARTVAGVDAQNAAQRRANDGVAAGLLTSDAANERMRIEATLRPMIAQADAASGKEKEVLTEQIIRLAFAQKAANLLAKEEQLLASQAAQTDQIAILEKERGLISATNRERAVALAILQKEQELKRSGQDGLRGAPRAVADAGRTAGMGVDLQIANDNYNASLRYTLDLLEQVDVLSRNAASGLAEAFDGVSGSVGRLGASIGGLTSAMTGYAARQEAINVQRKADQREQIVGSAAWMHAETLAARESANARVSAYGDMAAAGRSFFEEGTAGYKVLKTAEVAFRGLEMIMSIQAMSQKGAEVAAHVTAEGVKASASGVAAYARTLASLPFPFNLAAGAVVLASLAAVGVSIGGGRGGGAMPGATDAEDRQKAQGSGSVLGDSAAKSESIARSLELVAANTNKDLEYSNGMLRSLRSIDTGIGAVAAALARTLGASGALNTDDLNLGKTSQGPGGIARMISPISNLLPGLFGSSTKRTLQDQGLSFGSQSVADILAGGIEGQTYQQVLEQTKKKAFGVTYSNKSKSETTTGDLDAELAKQITDVIGSLKSGVLTAAGVLGVTGADAALDAFEVNLGKLSFKDMNGAEIQEALNGIFGKLGDDLAATAIPSLLELQKVGEGAFETLNRVARQYQVVDTSLTSIGMQFGAVGIASLAARERLVDLVGGIDELADQAGYFAENFLSDIERMAPIQRSVTAELNRLGLAGITTKDAFKDAVLGLDLTTEAGAKMYAALLDLAPAFAKVVEFQTEGAKAVQDARSALADAMERDAGALENYRDKFEAFADSLHSFLKDLYQGPQAMLSPEEQYRAAKSAFDQTSAAAAGGNEKAIGELQSVSQAYLDASKDYYASSAGYFADLDKVRQAVSATEAYAAQQVSSADRQLAELHAQTDGILGVEKAVLSLRDALLAYQGAVSAQAAAGAATAVPSPASNDNAASRGADWDSYLSHYPDVMAWAASGHGDPTKPIEQQSMAERAAYHWLNGGKSEGRTPYATGGIMDRPITLGESGIGGEAGSEGILPLANVGGKMGVHATIGGTMSKVEALLARMVEKQDQQIRELKAANVISQAAAQELSARLERVEKAQKRTTVAQTRTNGRRAA